MLIAHDRVFFSVLLIVIALGSIAGPIVGISKAASASTGLFVIIDSPTVPTKVLQEPEATAHTDIIFRDVTFAYPNRPETAVLSKLNLRFASGKITAIVGPSGSGKSTIVGLIERWYQLSDINTKIVEQADNQKDKETALSADESANSNPVVDNAGSIAVGNHLIDDLNLKWWRSQIGLVQQEPFLFNDTIYTNVAYGLIGSKWEKADEETKKRLVEEACTEAFADEFIKRLPLVCRLTHSCFKLALLILDRPMIPSLVRVASN